MRHFFIIVRAYYGYRTMWEIMFHDAKRSPQNTLICACINPEQAEILKNLIVDSLEKKTVALEDLGIFY